MVKKLSELLRNRVIRFIVIEGLIFAGVGVLSLASGISFNMGLTIVGVAILVLQFSGGRYRVDSRGMGSYALEKQYLKDVQNQSAQRASQLVGEFMVIGLVPLVIGILLAFVA